MASYTPNHRLSIGKSVFGEASQFSYSEFSSPDESDYSIWYESNIAPNVNLVLEFKGFSSSSDPYRIVLRSTKFLWNRKNLRKVPSRRSTTDHLPIDADPKTLKMIFATFVSMVDHFLDFLSNDHSETLDISLSVTLDLEDHKGNPLRKVRSELKKIANEHRYTMKTSKDRSEGKLDINFTQN